MVPPPPLLRRAAVTEEERRRNRMTSNRLSARRSRMKRQHYVDGLAALAAQLQQEIKAMQSHLGRALRQWRVVEQENRVLVAHARELCGQLLLRNSQLRLLGEVSGVPLDVPDVSDHLVQLYGVHGMPSPTSPPPPQQFQVSCQPEGDVDDLSLLAFMN